MTVLYTAASGALLFGALPAGMFADAFGGVPTVVLAGAFISLGSAGVALYPSGADAFFMVPLIMLGIGGQLSFFSCASVALLFPEDETLIFTLINLLFDASAGVPLLFYILYDRLELSRKAIFSGYALYALTVFASWALLFLRHSKRKPAAPQAATAPEQSPAAAAPDEGAPRKPPPLQETGSIAPLDPSTSVRDALLSTPFLLGLSWFLLHALHSNTYLGTAKLILSSLGDDGMYMQLYTAMLSSVILFIPCISSAIDVLGLEHSMHAVTALGTAHAALALVPVLPVQPLTFVVFAVYRGATFAVYSVFIARTFGFGKLGTLLGVSNFLGAAQNTLLLPPTSRIVLMSLGGDWSVVTFVFLLFTIPQGLCVATMAKVGRRAELV